MQKYSDFFNNVDMVEGLMLTLTRENTKMWLQKRGHHNVFSSNFFMVPREGVSVVTK
jgi:hypothetical protein